MLAATTHRAEHGLTPTTALAPIAILGTTTLRKATTIPTRDVEAIPTPLRVRTELDQAGIPIVGEVCQGTGVRTATITIPTSRQ
jgi:hypothetical protein